MRVFLGCSARLWVTLADNIKTYIIEKQIVGPIRSDRYSTGLLFQGMKWLTYLTTWQLEPLPAARSLREVDVNRTKQGSGQFKSLHWLRCSNSGVQAPSLYHKSSKVLILNSLCGAIPTSAVRNIKNSCSWTTLIPKSCGKRVTLSRQSPPCLLYLVSTVIDILVVTFIVALSRLCITIDRLSHYYICYRTPPSCTGALPLEAKV